MVISFKWPREKCATLGWKSYVLQTIIAISTLGVILYVTLQWSQSMGHEERLRNVQLCVYWGWQYKEQQLIFKSGDF